MEESHWSIPFISNVTQKPTDYKIRDLSHSVVIVFYSELTENNLTLSQVNFDISFGISFRSSLGFHVPCHLGCDQISARIAM